MDEKTEPRFTDANNTKTSTPPSLSLRSPSIHLPPDWRDLIVMKTLTSSAKIESWKIGQTSRRATKLNASSSWMRRCSRNKVKLEDLPEDVGLVDATWVRKYKRLSSSSLKANSRLCARGFSRPSEARASDTEHNSYTLESEIGALLAGYSQL